MEKIAGVVILYHPEGEQTLKNITTYAGHLDRLYLVDNSPKESAFLKEHAAALDTEVIYTHDGENMGIGYRLNRVAADAIKDGFKWLLTMDQDSSFEEGGFARYLVRCEQNKKDDVAIFCINFQKDVWPATEAPEEVISTITSGSIVSLDLHPAVGPWNEELFIDLVDAEYCYRAYNKHYKIIRFNNIILVHRIGYIQYGRSLKNFKLTPRVLHSPVRIYYIVRNCLYMLHKYPDLPGQARKEIKTTFALLKNNILYHKDRGTVIKNIIKGYIDYKRNKLGKLQSS